MMMKESSLNSICGMKNIGKPQIFFTSPQVQLQNSQLIFYTLTIYLDFVLLLKSSLSNYHELRIENLL